jgi:hypothetical protein
LAGDLAPEIPQLVAAGLFELVRNQNSHLTPAFLVPSTEQCIAGAGVTENGQPKGCPTKARVIMKLTSITSFPEVQSNWL